MATIYKTASTDWMTWSAAATYSDNGIVGTLAGATNSFTPSSTLTLNALNISADYSQTTITVSGSSAMAIGSKNSIPFTYSIVVADNKTFTYIPNIVFNNRESTQHSVYVGSGSVINANTISTDINTNTLSKYGPGTFNTATNTQSGSTSSTVGSWVIYEGTVTVGPGTGTPAFGTGVIDLRGGTFKFLGSRTFGNSAVRVYTDSTIDCNGFTGTFSGPFNQTGTLSITGTGSIVANGAVSCSLNIAAGTTLTMGASLNVTSATITGTGTIAMGSGSLGSSSSVNASGHTGIISGTCSISGGTSSFGSNFTGTLSSVSGTSVTFTGASAGAISGITATTAVLSGGTFGTSSGATALSGGTNVRILAGGGFNSGRSLTLAGSSKLTLGSSASVANAVSDTDTTTATIQCEDATTCTYSGTYSTTQTSGTVAVRATTSGGVLVLSGGFSGTQAGRTFAVNNVAGDTGTVKVTGSGFGSGTASPVTVSYGKLHLNSNSAIGLGGGLTVNPGATVACFSTSAYAANLTGNLTLAANSNFKFASA